MKELFKKLNIGTLITIAGAAITGIGSIISCIETQKKTDDEIRAQVKDYLESKGGEMNEQND